MWPIAFFALLILAIWSFAEWIYWRKRAYKWEHLAKDGQRIYAQGIRRLSDRVEELRAKFEAELAKKGGAK